MLYEIRDKLFTFPSSSYRRYTESVVQYLEIVMGKKDMENEGIGIVSIIIIVILAAIGLYYFISYHHPAVPTEGGNLNLPLETPAPLPDTSTTEK